jgi:hypothetical protein
MNPGKLTVVNKYKHNPTENDVYIGHGSLVGNPFTHLDSKFNGVTKVKSREIAVEMYKDLFLSVMREDDNDTTDFIKNLINKLKSGIDINLVCFCKPKACHGDVIANYINKQI